MRSYRHSGTLGDLIYSLSIVKKMAQRDVLFKVAIGVNIVTNEGFGSISWEDYDL